jgi:hypothetical protein
MDDVNGLLAGIGTVLGGLAGIAAMITVMHHGKSNPRQNGDGQSGDPEPIMLARGNNPVLWIAYAVGALAIAAFVVALVVIYQGLTPHTPLLQVPRFVAEFCGLLAVVVGFVVALPLHGSDKNKNIAEIGRLALLTGFAVLTGMFVVA